MAFLKFILPLRTSKFTMAGSQERNNSHLLCCAFYSDSRQTQEIRHKTSVVVKGKLPILYQPKAASFSRISRAILNHALLLR